MTFADLMGLYPRGQTSRRPPRRGVGASRQPPTRPPQRESLERYLVRLGAVLAREIRRGITVAAWAGLLVSSSSASASTDSKLAELLEPLRQRWKSLPESGWQLQGVHSTFSLDGDYQLLFNTQGHFRETRDGDFRHVTGFDGTHCWENGFTGVPRKLELGERESALASIWLRTGFWAQEDGPFQVLWKSEDAEQVTLELTLSATFHGELVVGRETGHPLAFRSDDRRVAQMTFAVADSSKDPWSSTIDQEDSRGDLIRLTVTGSSPASANSSSLYQQSLTAVVDTDYDVEVPSRIEVQRARSGHLLVRPLVNGEDLGWWAFDSGAGSSTIQPGVADQLGFEELGQAIVGGVGGSAGPHSFRRGLSFQLGPVIQEDPLLLEFDHSPFTPVLGTPIAGIVGFDLLARAVVELDLGAPSISLHDPSEYVLRNATWQPLALYGRHPCPTARFEGGNSGVFVLDTGSTGTVTFHRPAVENLQLLADREVARSIAGGVGGSVSTRTGVLEYFELGSHRFENPVVEFALEEVGSFADPHTVGNIGGAFLRPFHVVFDYSNHRIAFRPKAADD